MRTTYDWLLGYWRAKDLLATGNWPQVFQDYVLKIRDEALEEAANIVESADPDDGAAALAYAVDAIHSLQSAYKNNEAPPVAADDASGKSE